MMANMAILAKMLPRESIEICMLLKELLPRRIGLRAHRQWGSLQRDDRAAFAEKRCRSLGTAATNGQLIIVWLSDFLSSDPPTFARSFSSPQNRDTHLVLIPKEYHISLGIVSQEKQ